jgi:hypothetical protein
VPRVRRAKGCGRLPSSRVTPQTGGTVDANPKNVDVRHHNGREALRARRSFASKSRVRSPCPGLSGQTPSILLFCSRVGGSAAGAVRSRADGARVPTKSVRGRSTTVKAPPAERRGGSATRSWLANHRDQVAAHCATTTHRRSFHRSWSKLTPSLIFAGPSRRETARVRKKKSTTSAMMSDRQSAVTVTGGWPDTAQAR